MKVRLPSRVTDGSPKLNGFIAALLFAMSYESTSEISPLNKRHLIPLSSFGRTSSLLFFFRAARCQWGRRERTLSVTRFRKKRKNFVSPYDD
ncbi:hypothetical protein CEXT_156241 [Caerostris extrusa]|uniref:Uncharacterized protein n=1 Tax=Caerostris extrusa TaxID=172846 RepID=A0AAV4Y381_CAEEX|nr:hypothetical protein CEXT_156241 [Caerostris extrusa]